MLLARDHRVIAPHHPGFGKSGLPDWFGTVDDIAYLYLDLAAELKLNDAVLAGACFGGWIAAEMAVRDTNRFAGLVLAAPLGIKVGGVLDRDIADMHAIPRADFLRLAWADPSKGDDRLYGVCRTPNSPPSPGPRSAGAVRLEALHAQSATETMAAPDRYSHASDLGRAGRHRFDQLMARPGRRKSPAPR